MPSLSRDFLSKILHLSLLLRCNSNSGVCNPGCHVDKDLARGDEWSLGPSKLLG